MNDRHLSSYGWSLFYPACSEYPSRIAAVRFRNGDLTVGDSSTSLRNRIPKIFLD